jgi:hypothetical protein
MLCPRFCLSVCRSLLCGLFLSLTYFLIDRNTKALCDEYQI